jgi:hypothetical protein
MKATTYFDDFMAAIRLPNDLREKAGNAHLELRDRVENDADLSGIVITTFLQGSYRRHTGIKPAPGKKCDVDVVVVTRLDRNVTTPQQALDRFRPFLERNYKGLYRLQGRSWCITMGEVEVDLVPTSTPSAAITKFLVEARKVNFLSDFAEYSQDADRLHKLRESAGGEEWRSDVLWIPDREAKVWRETNPLAQIDWTFEKNARANGHYLDIVKSTKWWRREAYTAKHPKGYPLEHLVGASCPDGIDSIADGFVGTAEGIVLAYREHRANARVPNLQDHGVTSHNVLARLTPQEFAQLYDETVAMSKEARRALDEPDLEKSVTIWRSIFGNAFPEPPKYTKRVAATSIVPGRFA